MWPGFYLSFGLLVMVGLSMARPVFADGAPAVRRGELAECSVEELVRTLRGNGNREGIQEIVLPGDCRGPRAFVFRDGADGSALPPVEGQVVILGHGAEWVRSGDEGVPAFRFLTVSPAGRLHLDSITLRNGKTRAGESGGAIWNRGQLVVSHAHLVSNLAEESGGAIFDEGTTRIVNSTLSGNEAIVDGGAVRSSGSLSLTHVTVVGNRAGALAAGLRVEPDASALIENSIVAGNLPVGNCSGLPDAANLGGNLQWDESNPEDASCGSGIPVENPRLARGDDGLWIPREGSPAIDAALLEACLAQSPELGGGGVDQRGAGRPRFGPGKKKGRPACDVGAIEVVGAAAGGTETFGWFDPVAARFTLVNGNGDVPFREVFPYGPPSAGWIPIAGDWDADGFDTPGLYSQEGGTFFLRNELAGGFADVQFRFGPKDSGWWPVVGDWDGDGMDGVGLFDPVQGSFHLVDEHAEGNADRMFGFGEPDSDAIPVVGDWTGDGIDTVGIFLPGSSTFLLRYENDGGPADASFAFGPGEADWIPIAGDWDADGIDGIGLFQPTTGKVLLRFVPDAGRPDVEFIAPSGRDALPLVGNWDGR